MSTPRRPPGQVRDAILSFLTALRGEATVDEIHAAVNATLGEEVPRSSVRSYLNINTPGRFVRTRRGRYRRARL